MGRTFAASIFLTAFGLAAIAAGQGGGFGGQQGGQGPLQRQLDTSVQSIERSVSVYLNGDEIQSILTPGEFVEWKLTLKAGQVVVAEARSDAFDPALEIVNDAGKVLLNNDDRYPGDQRPLLFWRCDKDGDYALHLRCFHDKSGGQCFVRFKTYESIDLSSGEKVDREIDSRAPFLLRIPLKAGQIKELVTDVGGDQHFLPCVYNLTIAPDGLPDLADLTVRTQPALYTLMAQVDGDYYIMETPNGYGADRGKVRIGAREIVPKKLAKEGNGYGAEAPTNMPAMWELSVRAGEFFQASIGDLGLGCKFTLAEVPDISKFGMAKPETNPFFPHPDPKNEGPAFDRLSARARDGRIIVFRARRDAKLWLSCDGSGPDGKQFTLEVKPAAVDFAEDKTNVGKLRIANTDYWAFDAKAGDVMTLNTFAAQFDEVVIVRDPDLGEIRHSEAAIDQSSDNWRMIVQKPGRYIVAVSSLGDGGGGEYSLSRKVFHAKEFDMVNPAKAEISDGQVQIWKFTATPNKPLLIHWGSTNWSYNVSIYDDKGNYSDFQRQEMDNQNRLGILKVSKPQTYVIVLIGGHDKASYSIELNPIPGYKRP